jgi:uncharacterized protein
MPRLLAVMLLAACAASADPKRVLYFTLSSGFRHDSIPLSRAMLEEDAAATGLLEVTSSEDVSDLSPESLERFDAVFFFTSGELPINEVQKAGLLRFVREGKGFGGVHSATDTLYQWPEYGELIRARFDGHPWTQEIGVTVEDPEHSIVKHLAPGFRITDEIYQFREFSRERVRVLLRLDTESVDLSREGVHRGDGDFALAWGHEYGKGRVFYTALGHLDETWRDERFRKMVVNALLWMTGQADGEAAPRGRPE